MRIRLIIVAPVAALLCAGATMAQNKQASGPSTGPPKLVIESYTHDFGEVKAGEPLSFQFKVRNAGAADLLIKSVTPG
ncbi:MAG TPA: DUF1573 domain-containing protein [Blastocatellia bacterium]|nr:DUF1573 domain-containing protein [Blastocatellia bacterium]